MVIGDAGTFVVVLGLHPAAVRAEAAMLLAVHGICTAVVTWWARQLRSSPPPLRAKAAEASRVLAGSWLILLLLLITAGRRVDQLLPESGLVALFVATGISLVLGAGYNPLRRNPPRPRLGATGTRPDHPIRATCGQDR